MVYPKTIARIAVLLLMGAAIAYSYQTSPNWAISPRLHNMLVNQERPLEVLDRKWNQVSDVAWSVSDPRLAELRADEGSKSRVMLKALDAGEVTVSARLGDEVRSIVVKIWPGEQIPIGEVFWTEPEGFGPTYDHGMTVPSDDGPDFIIIKALGTGSVVRGLTQHGIQLWKWVPDEPDARLFFVCGDNHGGAILKLQRAANFKVFQIGPQGQIQWTYEGSGRMEGHALGYDDTLFLIESSLDGYHNSVIGIDSQTGRVKFGLPMPSSTSTEINVKIEGTEPLKCAPGWHRENLMPVKHADLFVGTDGDAYTAFTNFFWTSEVNDCVDGVVLTVNKFRFQHDNTVILWKITPDGEQTSTVVQQERITTAFGKVFTTTAPTGNIIPDGHGGVLLPIRVVYGTPFNNTAIRREEFIYRITDQGQVAFKFPLPAYNGACHDEMVLGEDDQGFATRGGTVVSFNASTGDELWRYDTGTPDIKLLMATSDGGVVVNTSKGQTLHVYKNAAKIENMFPDGVNARP